MTKVTSKLQVTIPKAIADAYGIAPGDEIEFKPAGEVIRVVPPAERVRKRLSVAERLRLFREDTARVEELQKDLKLPAEPPPDRGWTRDELYERGWKPGPGKPSDQKPHDRNRSGRKPSG